MEFEEQMAVEEGSKDKEYVSMIKPARKNKEAAPGPKSGDLDSGIDPMYKTED